MIGGSSRVVQVWARAEDLGLVNRIIVEYFLLYLANDIPLPCITLAMERQMYEIIQMGKPWTDPEFPPERKSLYDRTIDKEADPKTYNAFTWKRASAIFNPIYIFEDGVEPNDINQG